MTFVSDYPEGFSGQDILFDCPECGKNLGINRRGAGLVARCPDCGTRMRVPTPERFGDAPQAAESDTDVHTGLSESVSPPVEDEVHRLEVTLEDVQRRKDYLEQLRFQTEQHIERLREQMAVLQTALDRMVDILQDVSPENMTSDE